MKSGLVLALMLGMSPLGFTPQYSWASEIVNDVTNINPIKVDKVLTPHSSIEIVNAVKAHPGPISIGGGRYSMGGQTATEGALQIDMRSFNKVLHLDPQKKQIRVQTGIRWRDLQEVIDKENLSVKIMQSFSNFTVGGSLSVNAHGRYVGEGPLVKSVDSINVVLADGSEVEASRHKNPDIFFSAIGGYGGIGVITEAVLNLTDNVKIKAEATMMPVEDYSAHFMRRIRENKDAVLHNANIFPPDYRTVSAETWYKTTKPLTVQDRLVPKKGSYWLQPNIISLLSNIPFGSEIRQHVIEPVRKSGELVVWRNYEASLDVAQLEPKTPRLLFTYVLQEYFVPVSQLNSFIPKMRAVFQKHDVNVINVSIRHAHADPDTYLSWAPQETYSLVVYYKQMTTEPAKQAVGVWTREMIDEVLSVGGRYYLPYQLHATGKQFQKAYSNFKKFFEIKRKYDPTNKFRNKLWDRYYKPEICEAGLTSSLTD